MIMTYTTLTHMHALTGQHAYTALLFTCACYTTDSLLAFVRSSLARMHIYIHTYATETQVHLCIYWSALQRFCRQRAIDHTA